MDDTMQTLLDELVKYCRSNPRYYGMILPAFRIAVSRKNMVRSVASLTRRELLSHSANELDRVQELTSNVLVDASLGTIHAALWLPVAHTLAQSGVKVGLTSSHNHLPLDLDGRQELRDKSWFEFIPMPVTGMWNPGERLPPLREYIAGLPWRGIFGLAIALMQKWTDRMIHAWASILSTSSVKVFVTTEPYSCPVNALVYAARNLGIKTVLMQQGFPDGGAWRVPACDIAVVWTRLDMTLLRQNGWLDTRILIANNPGLPDPGTLREQRSKRRKELGLQELDFCVLFLGQVSLERDMFPVPGYLETCEMLGRGLKLAMQSTSLIPLLRPHPTDTKRETERVLGCTNLPVLAVSHGASLLDDLAAADVVISMNSAALEEAHLVGRPTLQIIASGFSRGVDFSIIGTPVARTAEELASLLTSRQWMASRRVLPVCRSVAEEISELVRD